MALKTIVSFNVNGIRAAFRKGLKDWILSYQPDFIGLQETKAQREQLKPQDGFLNGYYFFLSQCQRKGYSGVGVYCKEKPIEVVYDFFRQPSFDAEGRVIFMRFSEYIILNVYFPNGVSSPERLKYKMAFYKEFAQKVQEFLAKGEKVLVMGDVNTAHKPIDLARPEANANHSGFLPEERAWIDDFLSLGMLDTYRYFYPNKAEAYSWWDLKTAARERNIGWRLDYIFASRNLTPHLKSADILSQVPGSDHCPIVATLEF